MSQFNMHSIKRAARKEAWYADSWNPFRKNMGPRRATTWTTSTEPISFEAALEASIGRPQSGGTKADQIGTTISDSELKSSKLLSRVTEPVTTSYQLESEETAVERQSTRPISTRPISKPHRTTFYSKFRSKSMEAWLSMTTRTSVVEHTFSELDSQELFWDPFGSLSEKLTSNGYPDTKASPPGATIQSSLTTEASQKRALEPGVAILSKGTPGIERQALDIHRFQIKPTGILPLGPVQQLSYLRNKSAANRIDSPASSLFIVEEPSPSLIETLSEAFGCGIEVFNGHLKRASEDVEILLPSTRRSQSHVVIPYRTTYQPSFRKELRNCRNLRSSFSHGGLVTTEEHVTYWLSPIIDGSWTAVIVCDGNPILSGNASSRDESMRSSFESAINSVSAPELLDDPYMIVRILLRLVSTRWTSVIRDQEGYMLPGLKPQYTLSGGTDERLLEKESFGEYLKQTLGMLRMGLQIFRSLSTKSKAFSLAQDELLADYEYLANKVSLQIKQNTMSIPVITAMIGIEESRKAIQQAQDVKALTTLATVYIPLSFVAGIFGMNVTQLNPNPLVNIPLWLYFATALPITAVSMLLVWHWGWLKDGTVFIGRKLYLLVRILSRKDKTSSTADALIHAGTVGMAAGASDAFIPQEVTGREEV